MFKIISKNKYEELKEDLEYYMTNYQTTQSDLRKMSNDIDVERKNTSELLHIQNNMITNLEKENVSLLEQNKQLVNWIDSILNKVGVCEVRNRNTISIPIYKRDEPVTFSNSVKEMDIQNYLIKEEIIIPEIKFIKIK